MICIPDAAAAESLELLCSRWLCHQVLEAKEHSREGVGWLGLSNCKGGGRVYTGALYAADQLID